ncbi:hypothetical protein NA57DRAFT_81197 [Rhizodiscina lignyota]|uniref:DUF7165 domain-containing protein n=1 Tax=Rhizodiscina lignyota TaxID=1504668 RepID=A0A9P4I772_9PEZI|nr:hypothetical protein NA57DRAFT_81197 [Rhizodiscina lignyota]
MSSETRQKPTGLALDTSMTRDEEAKSDNRTLERASLQTATSSLDSAHFSSNLTATTTHTSYTTPGTSINSAVMSSPEAARPSQGFGQPETTIIELISTSATASAFPESFGLTISQRGQWIAAYTSTALYIIRSESLPQVTGRFFKVRRKPITMAISDYPQTIAILSNPHNVDVYSSTSESNEEGVWCNLKQRSIIFGHEISTIALSPDATILAAGFRGGVEIVSVAPDAMDNQRRQINCEPMADVAFSGDGRTLIATSTTRKTRPTTIISVGNGLDGPISDEGIMEALPPQQAWISQLLFPERATHARQAALLPDPLTGQVNELFAFNAENDSWGVFDLTMKRFSEKKVDVLNLTPSTRKMNYESALPAVSSDHKQIAIASKLTGRSDVLIYRVPFSWFNEDSGETPQIDGQEPGALPPAYVVLLLKGEDAAPESITTLRWLGPERPDLPSKRLIALTTSATHPVDEDLSAIEPAASGRILLMDLGSTSRPSSGPRKVTINFDELPEETLGDDPMDFEREVTILRSRTQAQRRRSSNNSTDPRRIPRASTSLGTHGRPNALLSPTDISETSLTRRHSLSSITSDETETNFGALVLEEPYSQGQPRSQFSLQRAATISAQSGANRRHLRALPDQPLEYRRADGLRWIPHESDADNWVPPPPPYTREVDPTVSQPLPGAEPARVPVPTRRPVPGAAPERRFERRSVRRSIGRSIGASASTPALVPAVTSSTAAMTSPVQSTVVPEQSITRPSTTSSTASALPAAHQIASLERRSTGEGPPRTAHGAHRVPSYDLNRPLPALPPESRGRPRFSRLATIASAVSGGPAVHNEGRRGSTGMTGADEKRKKKGARCIVM